MRRLVAPSGWRLVLSRALGSATRRRGGPATPTAAGTDAPDRPTPGRPAPSRPIRRRRPRARRLPSRASRSGSQCELRWYCCLGTGEDPPSSYRRGAGRRGLQRGAPRHPPDLRGRHLRRRPRRALHPDRRRQPARTSSARSASAAPRRSTASGSTSRRSSRRPATTSASTTRERSTSTTPADEGQIGLPFAIYPSMLWYKASLFEEAGLEPPPHAYGDPYVMPDGTEAEWDYDTVRELALMLTVDENGNDATQAGLRPGRASSSTASSRSGTTCAGSAPTSARDRWSPPTARRPRSPMHGPPPGSTSTTGCGPTTSSCPGPVFQQTPEFDGGGYAFFSGTWR